MNSSARQHHFTLSRHWIREIDRRANEEYGMSGLVLMENAARGAVDILVTLGCRGPVALVCGKGNNAGDGLAMARHLDLRSIDCQVLLLSDPNQLTGDALANYRIIAGHLPTKVIGRDFDLLNLRDTLASPEWIVDALLGTGATGSPRSPFADAITILNECDCRKFAVDVPSGLDCDTGQPSSITFRAHHTVTFVAPKPGLLVPDAQAYVGQLHVTDIGAPRKLVEEVLRESNESSSR